MYKSFKEIIKTDKALNSFKIRKYRLFLNYFNFFTIDFETFCNGYGTRWNGQGHVLFMYVLMIVVCPSGQTTNYYLSYPKDSALSQCPILMICPMYIMLSMSMLMTLLIIIINLKNLILCTLNLYFLIFIYNLAVRSLVNIFLIYLLAHSAPMTWRLAGA